ncbi:MAG: YHS domain-containing (seleno)protein [Rhodoferax sp.]|nr:YHS domain-containing (seleno)protein [Rhodoferax sp.]
MPTQFRTSRRSFVASTALMALAPFALPDFAQAYDELSTGALNVDANGIALKGFDPVSYFLPSGPVAGKAEFFAKHGGATYQFSSLINRDTFTANPAKYTPAYGGFCAMGVALEQKLDVNPQLWRIVDGKLYLNVHKEAQTRWLEDVKGNLAKADKNWPHLKDKAPKAL